MSAVVFWQDSPSIHQAPLIREFAKLWPGDVWIVAEAGVSSDRIRQGWVCPDFSPAKLLLSPKRSERLRLLEQTQTKGDVHIFSGFHAYPETYWTMVQARNTSSLIGVFAERGKGGSKFRSVLRWIRYVGHAIVWRNRLNFICTAGSIGVDWYSNCFFAKNKIFTFGYFVDQIDYNINLSHSFDIFKIIYVGSFVPWKGLDLLFYALQELKYMKWVLHLVGDGPLRQELENLARVLGIHERIVWVGTLANNATRQEMATSNLLVLPSRYDGWGAVVNEALMAGTPAVVSDACGACELIQHPRLGGVFHAQSVTSLRETLRNKMAKGDAGGLDRSYIQNWSKCIYPQVVAQYLKEIILKTGTENQKILAPWRKVQ